MSSLLLAPLAQAIDTPEVMAANAALLDRVFRKPPPTVPLRVGVLPADAVLAGKFTHDDGFWFCNRIWQDQVGSYDKPFAAMFYVNRKSSTQVYGGMFALDEYVVDANQDFSRLEYPEHFGKGARSYFNAADEAVLLLDYNQKPAPGRLYWALYLKRLKTERCGQEKLSECKHFEANAELYEFELKGHLSDFLRKAEIGKVHIESRCVGQRYLYHREPFLEKPSVVERMLNKLRND